jgi:AcrR family transcriptional regulator
VNDPLVLSGAVEVLATRGWEGLRPAGVASQIGRSVRTVVNRAADRPELAEWVIRRDGQDAFAQRWTHLLHALDEARGSLEPEILAAALADIGAWQSTHQATALAELLVIGQFDPAIAPLIESQITDVIAKSLDESTAPTDIAAMGSVAAVMVGLMMASRSTRAPLAADSAAFRTFAEAVLAPDAPSDLPDVDAAHMDIEPQLDQDPLLDQVLNNCLLLIGVHGYEGVTVAEVAELAGTSEGTVFGRYGTKAALFQTALARQLAAGLAVNEAFVASLVDDYGRGIANAVQLREAMRPHRQGSRTRSLEFKRLEWHQDDALAKAREQEDAFRASLLEQPGWADYETEGEFHVEIALFLGCITLVKYVPAMADLPLNSVTVPWDRLRRAR